MDITMTVLKMTARAVSPTTVDLPGSITGADQATQADNLLRLQAEVGDALVRHMQNAISEVMNDLLRRINGDQPTLQKILDAMPGSSPEEAVSVALRNCAGCIDGAKAVRETEMTDFPDGSRGERKIEDYERAIYAQFLLKEAATDRVYAAGVAIGPLDKKLRNKQDPVFDGISEPDQDVLFPEYFRRYPRK